MAGEDADGAASRVLPPPSTDGVAQKTGGGPAARGAPGGLSGSDELSGCAPKTQHDERPLTLSSSCSDGLNRRARGEPPVGW